MIDFAIASEPRANRRRRMLDGAAPCLACWLAVLAAAPSFGQEGTTRQDEKQKLGERLIRDAASGEEADVMDRLVLLMDRSARKLYVEFDAGEETQALQRSIMARLDEAIRAAAAQRRPTRSRSQSAEGDRRHDPGDRQADENTTPAESEPATGRDASSEGAPGAAVSDAAAPGGSLDLRRRAWGHLPMRERDAILQGLSDEYLERYRAWVERYYKALQESRD